MCEESDPLETVKIGENTFEIYDKPLNFYEAKNRCECHDGRGLAMPKSKASFQQLSGVLRHLKTDAKYWRIGLNKKGPSFVWADSEVIHSQLDYLLDGTGNCVGIYVSRESYFLKLLQCEGKVSHNKNFGYICSQGHDSFTNDDPRNLWEATTIPKADTTSAEGNAEDAIMWIIFAILLITVLTLGVLLIKRRERQLTGNELEALHPLGSRNQAIVHDETVFGPDIQVLNQGAVGVGYASVENFQHITMEIEKSHGVGASGDSTVYDEIQSERDQPVRDVYAVVHKENRLAQGPQDERYSAAYAVFNKP